MLTIEGLTTDYGPVRAVDGVSFEVPEGSVTAVLGANGAGKTSLLRTITGLVRPAVGQRELGGRGHHPRCRSRTIVRRGHGARARGPRRDRRADRRREPAARRPVARDAEAAPLDGDLRAVPARSRSASASQPPGCPAASGRCSSIGRALVARPRALLLDEPSLGLAPRAGRADHGDGAQARGHASGWPCCSSSRTPAARCRSPTGAIVLNLGRVVAEQDPDELAADDQLLHAYLGF